MNAPHEVAAPIGYLYSKYILSWIYIAETFMSVMECGNCCQLLYDGILLPMLFSPTSQGEEIYGIHL
jgi:hypothetical protein